MGTPEPTKFTGPISFTVGQQKAVNGGEDMFVIEAILVVIVVVATSAYFFQRRWTKSRL